MPNPYSKSPRFQKFLKEYTANWKSDRPLRPSQVTQAYEKMISTEGRIVGVEGLYQALGGENSPYAKTTLTDALSSKKITQNMSKAEKAKLKQANKIKKIIFDTLGEPESLGDVRSEYKFIKPDLRAIKPGTSRIKTWTFSKSKMNELNKALTKNFNIYGLKENTIDNVFDLLDNDDFMKAVKNYKGGAVNMDSLLFKTVMQPGKGDTSYAFNQLGRILRGEIDIEGIEVDKRLGNKIIKLMAKGATDDASGPMYKELQRWSKFQVAKYFDSKVTYNHLGNVIRDAFKEAGIGLKGKGINIDEVFPLRTGQYTIGKGSGGYNNFIQFIDANINSGPKTAFDSRASTRYQEIIDAYKKENWPKVKTLVADHEKAIKNFYRNHPGTKGKVKLTQLHYNPTTHKFLTPEKLFETQYGKGTYKTIPEKIKRGMEKFYSKTKLSLDPGTIRTLEGTAREIQGLQKDSFSAFKKGMYKMAQENGIGVKKCGLGGAKKAEGGRIGFASGTQSFDDCMRGAIADETRVAKGFGAKAKQAGQRLLGVAKWAGKWIGLIDVPIEFAFALPALLRGDIEGAKRHTTFGLFGWGETQMEQMKETNPEAYKFLKHDNDVMNWQQAEWQLGTLK